MVRTRGNAFKIRLKAFLFVYSHVSAAVNLRLSIIYQKYSNECIMDAVNLKIGIRRSDDRSLGDE